MIVFQFWNFKVANNREPEYDLFGYFDGESLLLKLSKYTRMYFRNHSAEAPPAFQELLKNGSIQFQPNDPRMLQLRSLMSINYRGDISRILFVENNFKPIDLEFVLVQQLFATCSEVTNPILSVTVSDIVYVFNQLVTNTDQICLKNFPQDPIRILIRELGGAPIKLLLQKEELRMRINLQLACRFLYTSKAIVKCPCCHAPMTEEMIPANDFRDSQ